MIVGCPKSRYSFQPYPRLKTRDPFTRAIKMGLLKSLYTPSTPKTVAALDGMTNVGTLSNGILFTKDLSGKAQVTKIVDPVAGVDEGICVTGNEFQIELTGHIVDGSSTWGRGTGYYWHTSIRIKVGVMNQYRYLLPAPAMVDLSDNTLYNTFSAGPEGPVGFNPFLMNWDTGNSGLFMIGQFNKSTDLGTQEKIWKLNIGNNLILDQGEFIKKIIKSVNSYNSNTVYYYYPLPAGSVLMGYNSNSWAHGLLNSMGLELILPNILSEIRATGWSNPIPTHYFNE